MTPKTQAIPMAGMIPMVRRRARSAPMGDRRTSRSQRSLSVSVCRGVVSAFSALIYFAAAPKQPVSTAPQGASRAYAISIGLC
jgi:hypothetical protein